MADIYQQRHHAMATYFDVRISDEDEAYAAQAAQAAFDLLDRLESQLSRFRCNSGVAQIALLGNGERVRLAEATFACLEIAKRMEVMTRGAFSITASLMQTQATLPQWRLLPGEMAILCESGPLRFDLGAIGKGFALDRMADLLRHWDCPAFLLVAGGSSILAGDPPEGALGWSCGLGKDDSAQRFFLSHSSISGSGLAVKGDHILDPRTGRPAVRQTRAWALADTASESDALSTACMVLNDLELEAVLNQEPSWLCFLEAEEGATAVGNRELPLRG